METKRARGRNSGPNRRAANQKSPEGTSTCPQEHRRWRLVAAWDGSGPDTAAGPDRSVVEAPDRSPERSLPNGGVTENRAIGGRCVERMAAGGDQDREPGADRRIATPWAPTGASPPTPRGLPSQFHVDKPKLPPLHLQPLGPFLLRGSSPHGTSPGHRFSRSIEWTPSIPPRFPAGVPPGRNIPHRAPGRRRHRSPRNRPPEALLHRATPRGDFSARWIG